MSITQYNRGHCGYLQEFGAIRDWGELSRITRGYTSLHNIETVIIHLLYVVLLRWGLTMLQWVSFTLDHEVVITRRLFYLFIAVDSRQSKNRWTHGDSIDRLIVLLALRAERAGSGRRHTLSYLRVQSERHPFAVAVDGGDSGVHFVVGLLCFGFVAVTRAVRFALSPAPNE